MNAFALGSTFLMGLFGGVHCIFMCGGITGMLCAGLPPEARRTFGGRLRHLLGYNAGRIGAYSIAGGVSGAIGAVATSYAPVQGAQIGLRVIAALVMLGAGLYLAGVLKGYAKIESLGKPLWRRVEPVVKKLYPVRSPARAGLLGLVWGFLPCGLVYAALALALVSGSAAAGAATMAAFGLGTLPALLVAGGLAEGVRQMFRMPRVKQAAGIFIALSGTVHLTMVGMQAGWMPAGLFGEKPPCCAGHEH